MKTSDDCSKDTDTFICIECGEYFAKNDMETDNVCIDCYIGLVETSEDSLHWYGE